MKEYHGHYAFITGVLMYGILQGLCVVLADTNKVMYKATGSSLDLTVKYPKDSVSLVEWFFNGKLFAEYSKSRAYSHSLNSQFTGRIKDDNNKVGITVQDLQLQDSGPYSVSIDLTEKQQPTEEFTVYIQNPITAVQIKKNQTNSCDVYMKCAALGAERISYLWSGYKTGSGAQLQFSLSPADGNVTLNCTATNNVSNMTATETLSCSHNNSDHLLLFVVFADTIQSFMWIAIAGGAAFLLVIAVIAAISYWWRSHKGGSVAEIGTTVYADVNNGATAKKDTRSDSVNNGMTVYETVDDLRINPEMTIYAKVTLPQHAKVSATSSSPYQQVC
ncbi:signaling lymphocytic activation molecule [Clarias gariepinus]|uniref:signaling lymphocytic activation molecule n=1 Tax=Clarias gariepinus TaxID=13013 RepID=UPI00234D6659|nr:signaling lymphocytic activation molecule [Clarias gariepinus]